MALSIITDKFRTENAKKFVQSIKNRPYPADFSTTQSDYERVKTAPYESELDSLYMFIGKITSWYDEYNLPVGADTEDTPVPDAFPYQRQVSEVWSNAIVAKRVDTTNVRHVIQRENWAASTTYPYYRSDASNTTTFANAGEPNFYVLDTKEFRVYKCLFNFYDSESQQRPTEVGGIGGDPRRFGAEPFETSDGYVWKYMYTIDPADAINFVTDNYIPVQKDGLNDDGSGTDNSTVDGGIYRIILSEKTTSAGVVTTPSAGDFVRVRVDGVDGSTDLTVGETELQIDLTGVNGDRIAASVDNDMVGYQLEHLLSDNTIEIGKITASSVTTASGGGREFLNLTMERVDGDTAGFTVTTGDTWFISPYVEIRGEGQNASAMVYISGETGFDTTLRRLYPESPVSTGSATDVIVNTVGSGYRNIFYRNDTDGTLNSYVKIKMGSSVIGAAVTEGTEVDELDLEMVNIAQMVSVTPFGGHSYDNVSELYGYTIMINHTFAGDESGSATVANDFRQIALIQNPLEQPADASSDYTIGDATIYRQTIRLEFDGDITPTIHYDDEISNKDSATAVRSVFGRVVDFAYNSTDNKTLVYLSSSSGFFERTASDIYNLDASNRLFLSYDISAGNAPYTALTLSPRLIIPDSDGEYQKGLGSGVGNPGLAPLSGDMMYLENRQPIIRVADQSENIKLIIEY